MISINCIQLSSRCRDMESHITHITHPWKWSRTRHLILINNATVYAWHLKCTHCSLDTAHNTMHHENETSSALEDDAKNNGFSYHTTATLVLWSAVLTIKQPPLQDAKYHKPWDSRDTEQVYNSLNSSWRRSNIDLEHNSPRIVSQIGQLWPFCEIGSEDGSMISRIS